MNKRDIATTKTITTSTKQVVIITKQQSVIST